MSRNVSAPNSKTSQNSKMSHEVMSQKSNSRQALPTAQTSKSKSKHTKGKSSKKEKSCCATAVCDPSPEAQSYAEIKAMKRSQMPDQPTYPPWVRSYLEHRKAVKKVKPSIDCHEPLVLKENYCQGKQYNIRGDAFKHLEMENTILARRIADIYYQGSAIDDRHDPNIPTISRIHNRHAMERERKAERLFQENINLYKSLQKVKPQISRQKHIEWYSEMEKYMDIKSVWPLHFKPPPCPGAYKNMMAKDAKNPKQYAYLQVEMEDTMVCNVVCELFASLCPFTARNFQALCTYVKRGCECRSYRCKTIDKLVSIPRKDGSYERAYWQVGGTVDAMPELISHLLKEDSKIKHTKEGYLTRPKGMASGEFYITSGPAPYLDDLCYVFGKVVGSGISFLKKMGETNIDTQGIPKTIIHITDAGVVGSPDDVPRPMLMRDFILRVQDDIAPIMDRDPDSSDEENNFKVEDDEEQKADE